jgi:hypothetical protein
VSCRVVSFSFRFVSRAFSGRYELSAPKGGVRLRETRFRTPYSFPAAVMSQLFPNSTAGFGATDTKKGRKQRLLLFWNFVCAMFMMMENRSFADAKMRLGTNETHKKRAALKGKRCARVRVCCRPCPPLRSTEYLASDEAVQVYEEPLRRQLPLGSADRRPASAGTPGEAQQAFPRKGRMLMPGDGACAKHASRFGRKKASFLRVQRAIVCQDRLWTHLRNDIEKKTANLSFPCRRRGDRHPNDDRFVCGWPRARLRHGVGRRAAVGREPLHGGKGDGGGGR